MNLYVWNFFDKDDYTTIVMIALADSIEAARSQVRLPLIRRTFGENYSDDDIQMALDNAEHDLWDLSFRSHETWLKLINRWIAIEPDVYAVDKPMSDAAHHTG